MSILPAVSEKRALIPPHFPAPYLALIFRNFGIVPTQNIAKSLATSEESIYRAAELMGLSAREPNAVFLERGFLSVIRANWHLTDYRGICALLGITEERLNFIIKEDDFFWVKVGFMKPAAPRALWKEPTQRELFALSQIKDRLAKSPLGAMTENAFSFLKPYQEPVSPQNMMPPKSAETRMIYSYFALYGDPLLNPRLDPYPDKLLEEYAHLGVNGIWLQGILYQLVKHRLCPDISQHCDERIAALNELVARAARFGIRVYLYFNEPRSLPRTFLAKHPELAGVGGVGGDNRYQTLCTSVKEVQEYLEDAAFTLFSQVPALGGFFTITRSENPTTCYSHDVAPCPRCEKRGPAAIVSEVNNLLWRGAKRASKTARAFAWTWGWKPEWAQEAVNLLDDGITVMNTSETGIPTEIGGVKGSVIDYSMSQIGPGALAKKIWTAAKTRGLSCAAKVQLNNSWELSAVPYLPVFSTVYEHAKRLEKAGVSHLLLSWTLGGSPSPNLYLVNRFLESHKPLSDLLTEYYGAAADTVNAAQEAFCRAFSNFPFDLNVLYFAPLQLGCACPFYRKQTEYKATMTGFPYDDLATWRHHYPEDVFEAQFALLADGWKEGCRTLDALEYDTPEVRELRTLSNAALAHFRSMLHQIRFVRARDAGDFDAVLSVLDAESAALELLAKTRQADSRIGFEAANHYFYTVRDLQEKVLNIQDCRAYFAARKEGSRD